MITKCNNFNCIYKFGNRFICKFVLHDNKCNPDCKIYQCCVGCSAKSECPDEELLKQKIQEWEHEHDH